MTPHFKLSEFTCKCGCRMPASAQVAYERLARALEVLRAELGCPINVISGYRCHARNAAVGGAALSQHVIGAAVDIQVDGHTGETLAAVIEGLIALGKMPDGGIGTYPDRKLTCHYDLRRKPARWQS